MGCFQVFEDHEGIEADILRRLAGLGGRPEARSAGQRPALLVVSPAPPSAVPSQPPAAPPCCPGIRPCQSWNSRPPAPSAMAQAPQHPHHLQPDRGPALGGPSAGAGHRPGTGGGAAGVPLASLSWGLPQAALAVAGALLLLGIPRSSSPPPPSKNLSLRLTNLPV